MLMTCFGWNIQWLRESEGQHEIDVGLGWLDFRLNPHISNIIIITENINYQNFKINPPITTHFHPVVSYTY